MILGYRHPMLDTYSFRCERRLLQTIWETLRRRNGLVAGVERHLAGRLGGDASAMVLSFL